MLFPRRPPGPAGILATNPAALRGEGAELIPTVVLNWGARRSTAIIDSEIMEEIMKTHARPSVSLALFLFLLGGMTMAPLSAQYDRAKERQGYFRLLGCY